MCKDLEGGNTIVFDKRWTQSMLLFYRWLTGCPTAQYNRDKDDFAINGLIMLFDDSKTMKATRDKKNWCLDQVILVFLSQKFASGRFFEFQLEKKLGKSRSRGKIEAFFRIRT